MIRSDSISSTLYAGTSFLQATPADTLKKEDDPFSVLLSNAHGNHTKNRYTYYFS